MGVPAQIGGMLIVAIGPIVNLFPALFILLPPCKPLSRHGPILRAPHFGPAASFFIRLPFRQAPARWTKP